MKLKKNNYLYLFIILGIIIASAILYFQIKQKEEKQIIQLIEKKSTEVDKWILEKKHRLEKLSKNLEKVVYNKKSHLKLMKKANKEMGTNSVFSGFENGNYFDTQGYWINNFDPRVRPWYIETFENKKTTISGPMYYDDISGQKVAWWSISSLIFKDDKPFGVIASEILPEMINNLLKELQINDLEQFFLFHKKTGIIVSAKDRDKEFEYIQDIFSKEIFEKLIENKNNKISFSNQDINKIAYIKTLEEAPWILCAIKK